MIVREITTKDGVKTVKTVDYKTGKEVTAAVSGGFFGRDWHNHWSMSLGVTDPATGVVFKKRCAAAGVAEPKFRMGNSGQVLVNNERHAKQLRALHPSGPMVDFESYY